MHVELYETPNHERGNRSGDDHVAHAMPHGLIWWQEEQPSAKKLESILRERGFNSFTFVDDSLFSPGGCGRELARRMRQRGMNVLWNSKLSEDPGEETLREMRLSGCRSLELCMESDLAVELLPMIRLYGFDVQLREGGRAVRTAYTVAEREAVSERLPGLHSVQFDLAVAYFKARRFSEVMLPLGKAMTLGFPQTGLCLNLLACLSAVKHYPDQVAGLLQHAENICPHPVVFRNRERLKSWLESGGDSKGVRLELEACGGTASGTSVRV